MSKKQETKEPVKAKEFILEKATKAEILSDLVGNGSLEKDEVDIYDNLTQEGLINLHKKLSSPKAEAVEVSAEVSESDKSIVEARKAKQSLKQLKSKVKSTLESLQKEIESI